MTRLNKDIKAKILQNALNAAPVNTRLEELNAMKHQLAVDIYDSVANGHNPNEIARQIKELARDSPFCLGVYEADVGVGKSNHILCSFGGMQEFLYFPDDGITRYQVARNCLRFTADHEFSARFTKIAQELKKCEEEKESLQIDIQTILNSCRTTAQLEKYWPASVNFLEGCEVCAEIKGLPAVLVDDLNAKLGL